MKPYQKWVATGELPPNPGGFLELADKLSQAVIEKLEEERKEEDHDRD